MSVDYRFFPHLQAISFMCKLANVVAVCGNKNPLSQTIVFVCAVSKLLKLSGTIVGKVDFKSSIR